MASASIRGGSTDDRQRTKVFIQELVGDQPSAVFKDAPKNANSNQVEFEQIDWKQLANDCVSNCYLIIDYFVFT